MYSSKNGSLVPRPLPDFVSQLWRKIGRRPGTITTSQKWWTQLVRNVDSVSWWWQHAHAICSQYSKWSNSKACLDALPTTTNFASTKSLTKDVDISRRHYVRTLIEKDQESSWLRASMSLRMIKEAGLEQLRSFVPGVYEHWQRNVKLQYISWSHLSNLALCNAPCKVSCMLAP